MRTSSMACRSTKIVLLAALVLSACSNDASTPPTVFSADAGTAPGYVGGVPVTFADGTNVTTPGGSVVTTPELPGGKGTGIVVSTTAVTTVGSTSVTSPATPPILVVPKLGVYGFRESTTPDDGGLPKTRDLFFTLTSPDQNVQIRWQESDAAGTPAVSNSFVETHGADGLALTRSTLNGSDACDWLPKAVELPKSIVAKVGATAKSDSECSVEVNGEAQELKLHSEVKSLGFEDITVAGVSYRCIKIERNRILKQGKTTVTTAAREWYAFDLGIRIRVSDHTLTETDSAVQAQSRELLLTATP